MSINIQNTYAASTVTCLHFSALTMNALFLRTSSFLFVAFTVIRMERAGNLYIRNIVFLFYLKDAIASRTNMTLLCFFLHWISNLIVIISILLVICTIELIIINYNLFQHGKSEFKDKRTEKKSCEISS